MNIQKVPAEYQRDDLEIHELPTNGRANDQCLHAKDKQ